MVSSAEFLTTTPRYELPLLFAGQAQKEITVNEALTCVDLLLHGAIEGERKAPPLSPSTGSLWLIAPSAQGEWLNHDGELAGWSEGGWRFVKPRPGMRLYDREHAAFRTFTQGWELFSAPSSPAGGAVIDSEARQAIAHLFSILAKQGIFKSA